MANYITYTTPTMTFSADGTNVWSLNEFNAPSVTLEGSIVLDKDTLPCVSVSISDILNRLVSGHGSSVYNKLMDYALAKGMESSEKKTKKQPKKKGNKHEKSKKA